MVKAKWNQDINVPAGKQVGTHRWGVDYAAEVHEGSMSPQGVEKPARPWVGINIDSFDFTGTFVDAYGETGDFSSAFVAMSEAFGEVCQASIKDVIWEWPRSTVRSNGSVVESPRDIVDMGTLYDSYSHSVDNL